MTDTQNIDMGFADQYKEAAAEIERLAPGKYYVQFPDVITSEIDEYQGRTGLKFNLGQSRIVADADANPIRGFINRFYSVSTLFNGDNVIDLVRLMTRDERNPNGVDIKTLQGDTLEATRANFDALFATFAGQRTPFPIRFEYQGSYKHPISGKKVYKNSKDFLTADAKGNPDYTKVGFVVDNEFTLNPPFPADIAKTDYKAQRAFAKANGWTEVFANFEPGYRAWATKG